MSVWRINIFTANFLKIRIHFIVWALMRAIHSNNLSFFEIENR